MSLCAAGSLHAQIYRCGNSYSQQPCTDGTPKNAGTSSQPYGPIHAPPPEKNRAHPVAIERKKTLKELDKAQNAPEPAHSALTTQKACAAAQRRIEKIDDLARRGGSAQKMEQLREDRKATRDRQFRLGC